jgi:hypothetical protein
MAAEMNDLEHLPDSAIDTSDIPERTDWTGAMRRRFDQGTTAGARSLRRMSNEQKSQIRTLLAKGKTREAIADEIGVTPGQVSAIRAWMTMNSPGLQVTADEGEEIIEAAETTFGLERDLQGELRKNIGQLEPDLVIIDGERERRVKSGRIDILAKDSSGTIVVIELKAGRADRDAIGQLLAYMGELMEETPSVRGILVAAEFSPRAVAAAKAAPNIRLECYRVHFSFSAIPARAA